MTYQTTNDFDLTRQDGTYTGATGELVVSDGGTITLPTPTAGEKFGVRALRNDVTLLSNGSIEASTSDRRIDSEGNSVFVSDGTEWYLVSGNEYFGFDIPDSAVWQVDPDTFTDGDTVWTDDVGSNDISITGDPSKTTFNNGDPAVAFDGTDDYGLHTLPTELDGSGLESFALEMEFAYTATGSQRFGLSQNKQNLILYFNTDEGFNSEDGNVNIYLRDDPNGDSLNCAPTTNPSLNDGNKHTLLWNVVDATTNDMEIYIDGVLQDVTFENQQSPSGFSSWNNDMAISAVNDDGTVGEEIDMDIGKYRFHGTSISGPTL